MLSCGAARMMEFSKSHILFDIVYVINKIKEPFSEIFAFEVWKNHSIFLSANVSRVSSITFSGNCQFAYDRLQITSVVPGTQTCHCHNST
jgi:hypothetical protein